jgi:hypothetical protein
VITLFLVLKLETWIDKKGCESTTEVYKKLQLDWRQTLHYTMDHIDKMLQYVGNQ